MLSAAPPILQFGTGRFLQAHVDLFVSEAAAHGLALGGITVVQGTADPASTRRLQAIARPEGFEVVIRGLVAGRPVEERRTCRSVHEALEARRHWPQVRDRARGPVRVIVSNTGDTGWALDGADSAALLDPGASAPNSFPARLLVLLHDRWQAQPEAPLSVLPCELVARNGEQLRSIVALLAGQWASAPAFVEWLCAHVVWANSLVDRIVSEPLDPVGAVTEPYALWAIERQPRLQLPCTHPAIVLTDELLRYQRLKLFLLNLGHTVLADAWRHDGHPVGLTVLQAMQDPALREPLEHVWAHEVLPVFDALGQAEAARDYLVGLRERLLNPFLAHRIADIAQNHAQKVARRIEPLVDLATDIAPGLAQPRLRAVMARARDLQT